MSERDAGSEREYRRGYRDGFIVAANAMADMQHGMGGSIGRIYDRLFEHWEHELLRWLLRAPADGGIELPPTVDW